MKNLTKTENKKEKAQAQISLELHELKNKSFGKRATISELDAMGRFWDLQSPRSPCLFIGIDMIGKMPVYVFQREGKILKTRDNLLIIKQY